MSDERTISDDRSSQPPGVPITVNGKAVTARPGEYVIAAAERAGAYIPRFCYHPRMESVGMCRMCLVEIDTGRGPQLQPSCMVSVAPDMLVETESPASKRAQEGIIELLLTNHPLDCPVCDKGGECPLQDQAFSHGPGESRYIEEKRHYEKPIPISDLVLLDRERCILCDRCTRFADEVAGDALISFTHRGNETQVMTFPDEPFASYFSGNTVQICPVGALTAEPYRFKSRPWDLAESESTCTNCSVGCRITVQSSRDELVRFLGVGAGPLPEGSESPVNWGWLCDKGRFGFQSIESPDRLGTPLVRTGDDAGLVEASWSTALAHVAGLLGDTPADRIALLGGSRGTNEDAFAWAQLADALAVKARDAQVGDGLPAALLDLPRATIDETAAAATVIVVGVDVKEELPILYLRLRHVAERRTTRIVELTPTGTGLSRNAWRSLRVEPGAAAAATAALSSDEIKAQLASGPVVVVAGRGNLAESSATAANTVRAVLEAVAAVQPDVKVLPGLRRGNVVGALQLGLRPDPTTGSDAAGILRAAAAGDVDVLVLVGSDPLVDFPDTVLARNALERAGAVVAVDTFLTDSSSLADVVLPAAAFAEKAGTTTNLEGRVTTLSQRVTPTGTARPDWMIAAELADLLGYSDLASTLESVESITATIARRVPAYAGATSAALAGNSAGVLAVPSGAAADPFTLGDFAAPERNSYDYRLVVARKLYDQATSTTHAPSLAPLADDSAAYVNPADADRIGAADRIVRLIGGRATVTLPVEADAAVPRGTVLVQFNRGSEITTLIEAGGAVTDVRIEAGAS